MAFESGVKRYIRGSAKVEVFFPVDWKENSAISCNMCKFFSRSTGKCYLTQEVSEYPQHYVGSHCPLEIDIDNEMENENV